MPLRKSPVRTPALLAANRANSLKSCGPRTPRGKARVSLNALKHGRHARRLPEKLVRAGYLRELALYARVHSFIVRAFQPHGRFEEGVAAALAAKAWCLPRLARRTTSAGSEWSSGSSGGALRPGRCAETGPIGPVGRRAQTIGPETGRMGLTGFGAGTAAGGLAGCPTR